MIIGVTVTCPYCMFRNDLRIEVMSMTVDPKPCHCNEDEGGCGRLFAVSVMIPSPKVTVYKLEVA